MVARYNPCGAFVDIGRVPYKTKARLYPDSTEEFEIEWYVCRDDAPKLPYPSAINNLKWCEDRDEYLPTVVGEIFETRVDYDPGPVKPAARGTHQCGTPADFAGDGVFDPDGPPVEYRPDGLPVCCVPVVEPCEVYMVDVPDQPPVPLSRTSVTQWSTTNLFLSLEPEGYWYLWTNTPFRQWVKYDWDGQGCADFEPQGGWGPAEVCCYHP